MLTFLYRCRGFDSRLGHMELRIYLALICIMILTSSVSGVGDVRFTIWWNYYSVGKGVMSWRYKCVAVIDQMGESSFYLFGQHSRPLIHLSWIWFTQGHMESWIYLALVCLVIITASVSGVRDFWSITIWWQQWSLGFHNIWVDPLPHWIMRLV